MPRTVVEPIEYWDVIEEEFDQDDFDPSVLAYVDESEAA